MHAYASVILAQVFSHPQRAEIAMAQFHMNITSKQFVVEFKIGDQKHDYFITSEHARIVDGRTYLKLCRRSTVVRRMLAVQADVDNLKNEPMWVLARSNVIDMIAELRFRKMKEIVLGEVHGKHAYWNQSETPLGDAHHLRSKHAADVRYKFWKNPRFQRAIATVPDTLEIECPIDGVDTVPLVVLPHRKGPAWIQMTSTSMAWLTSAVAAQFADGRVVPKNQPRKAMKLSEAIESTTASDRDITETFANESDEDTASEPEPSSELTSMPPTVVSAIAMPEPEPSHELTSTPPTVVSAVASNAGVQTQLGRFFTTTNR